MNCEVSSLKKSVDARLLVPTRYQLAKHLRGNVEAGARGRGEEEKGSVHGAVRLYTTRWIYDLTGRSAQSAAGAERRTARRSRR